VHFENIACNATCIQWADGTIYFAKAISYETNILMKSTTGVNTTNPYLFIACEIS